MLAVYEIRTGVEKLNQTLSFCFLIKQEQRDIEIKRQKI